MKCAAVLLDLPGAASPDDQRLFSELTLSKIRTMTDSVYVLTERAAPAGTTPMSFQTARGFLAWMAEKLPDTAVLILNLYTPLLDLEAARKMLDDHSAMAFDYSYPENLPEGLLPEILDTAAADYIKETLPENLGMFQKNVREVFERELSSYDCNIFITENALVRYRIPFTPVTANSCAFMKAVLQLSPVPQTMSSIQDAISNNPLLARQIPTYIELELTTAGQDLIYPGLTRPGGLTMAPELLTDILDSVSAQAPGAWVSCTLTGDSFLYPAFDRLLQEISRRTGLTFVLESRGYYLNAGQLESALALPNVIVIVDMSAARQETFARYKQQNQVLLPLRPLETLEAELKSVKDPARLYVQFTRTPANENELAAFYEKWRDWSSRIVIRKPDSWGGKSRELVTVDLSPVARHECVHLKNDLMILADGSIPLCRQNAYSGQTLTRWGNQGLTEAWKALEEPYLRQCGGDYSKPDCCRDCDDWWVFNA